MRQNPTYYASHPSFQPDPQPTGAALWERDRNCPGKCSRDTGGGVLWPRLSAFRTLVFDG